MGINVMNPNRHPADERADLRDPYEAHLQELAEREAAEQARYEAHLKEQARQEKKRIADEDIYPAMFCAVLKLARRYRWALFPANLEWERGN